MARPGGGSGARAGVRHACHGSQAKTCRRLAQLCLCPTVSYPKHCKDSAPLTVGTAGASMQQPACASEFALHKLWRAPRWDPRQELRVDAAPDQCVGLVSADMQLEHAISRPPSPHTHIRNPNYLQNTRRVQRLRLQNDKAPCLEYSLLGQTVLELAPRPPSWVRKESRSSPHGPPAGHKPGCGRHSKRRRKARQDAAQCLAHRPAHALIHRPTEMAKRAGP